MPRRVEMLPPLPPLPPLPVRWRGVVSAIEAEWSAGGGEAGDRVEREDAGMRKDEVGGVADSSDECGWAPAFAAASCTSPRI